MEADIREFLLRFSPDELVERRILRTADLFLQGASVSPLIVLMEEHGLTRVTAEERDWYINSDGSWSNPGSGSRTGRKSGDTENTRGVFNNQNKHINPFWGRTEPFNEDAIDDLPNATPEVSEIRFGLERDLQRALRTNIAQLEPGLAITDGGSEKAVDAGRIDITAADANGNLVVIELKAGTAQPDSVAQLLAYMGTIENPDGQVVRGFLVANDFAPRVVQAAKAVPSISLKAYSLQFSFQDR